jgi:hypothetical protein
VDINDKTLISVFSVFLFAVVPCVFSVPLDELVIPGYAAQLRSSDDLIVETQMRNPSPKLLPLDNDLRQFVTRAVGALNPNMMVETLYLYKKPEHSRTSVDSWDNVQKTGLFNQLLAISTLTGIEYYSASRGETRTFFEYSQVIDGPETKYPLPDPVYTSPPEELTLYARQVDLTFGDNVYHYDYLTARSGIFFVQENITALTIALIPVVGKNNLRSVLAVFDCGDVLLIYAVSTARTLSVPGMGERIGNSFRNRAEAVLKWFAGRADMVFSAE